MIPAKYFLLLMLNVLLITTFTHGQTAIQYPKNITVAKDGSGNYKTIQEAVNAIRAYSPEHNTIYIKNGVYNEKVNVPAWVTNISFVGESRENTIISYNDYSGKFISSDTVVNKQKFTTFTTYTMYVAGNDVTIENLTIRNTAGRVGQAVALHVDGDRFVIKNCNLLGNQDTLLTANDDARQYYLNCYIEGTTDFIFGNATAIFQDCTIKNLSNSFITAASTTQHQTFGYVFFNCKLIAAEEAKLVYLGRPWRAYAKVAFIGCDMGKHIRPEGWENWGRKENEATAYYAEYNNTGEGAATGKRVAWSHQLSKKEAKKYTLENIFSGWKP
ncbi:MAG: pectinesterase family protein [Bacteroidota bacterium]